MSKKSKHLVRQVNELVIHSARLREMLKRYEKASTDFAKHIDGGEPALSALGSVRMPLRQKEVTETFAEFEEARHQVRLALLALCVEEGANRSEVGRVLGVSRQLISRLSIEAERS